MSETFYQVWALYAGEVEDIISSWLCFFVDTLYFTELVFFLFSFRTLSEKNTNPIVAKPEHKM